MAQQVASLNRCRAFQAAGTPHCKAATRTRKSHVTLAFAGARAQDTVQLEACSDTSRRAVLALPAVLCASSIIPALAPCQAKAASNPLKDLTQRVLRPDDVGPEQAAVVFLDARSVLREVAQLAATAPDSMERFNARKEWPGYAKWLRLVGPAAPVLAAAATGSKDVQATLSEEYGGSGGSAGVADEVYVCLGRVLTISGRTIKDEAQADPALAQAAIAAIEKLLDKVPAELIDKAQQYRIARAAGK